MPAVYRLHLHFAKKDGSHLVDESFMLYVHVTPGVSQQAAELTPTLDVEVAANVSVLEDGSLSTDCHPFSPPKFTADRKVVNLHAFYVAMPKDSVRRMCKLTVTARYTGRAGNHPAPGQAEALICWNGDRSPQCAMENPKGTNPVPDIDSPIGGTYSNPAHVALGPNNSLPAFGTVNPCSTPVSVSLTSYVPNPPPPPAPPPPPPVVVIMTPCPVVPQGECWASSASGVPPNTAFQLTATASGGGSSTIFITT